MVLRARATVEIAFAAVPVRSRLAALALRSRIALVPVTRPLEWTTLPFPRLALALAVTAGLLAPLAVAFPPFALTLAAELLAPFAALAMIAARPAALPEWPRRAVAAALAMIEGRPA